MKIMKFLGIQPIHLLYVLKGKSRTEKGQNSDCDLDSICSSDDDYSDNRFDQLDREFKNVGNLFKGVEA